MATRKERIVWEASDGTEHETERAADQHDIRCAAVDFLAGRGFRATDAEEFVRDLQVGFDIRYQAPEVRGVAR